MSGPELMWTLAKGGILDRRRFLQACGLGGASLLLPSLARGQESCIATPKRLVLFYTLHGTVYERWRFRPQGLPENQDWVHPLDDPDPLSFSEILRPLHDMRSKLQIIDGLGLVTALDERRMDLNRHTLGHVHSLTGAFTTQGVDETQPMRGASIDQIIAQGLGAAALRPSIELAVGDTGQDRALFGGPRAAIPSEVDPLRAFERLFSSFSTGQGNEADPLRAAQGSVLDLVSSQYGQLAERLGGEDRRKLELHRDLLRDLEVQLASLAELECAAPALSPIAGAMHSGSRYREVARAQFQLVASALSCDMTRVTSVLMGLPPNELVEAPPGDLHADYAHRIDRDRDAMNVMTRYAKLHSEQFSELIGLLDSIPEGNGTLLDNCLVVWCGELADGLHGFTPWPVVVAGGGCGSFQTGRYIYRHPTTPSPSVLTSSRVGLPHNRFWVSVARAMGVDIDRLGNSTAVGRSGETIDLSGPMEGL